MWKSSSLLSQPVTRTIATLSDLFKCDWCTDVLFCSKVLKIAILAEKYAHDYTWYVDTILNLIRLAGDYVSEEVWYRIIQIVINKQDVQGYAAKTCFEVRKINSGPCTLAK